MKGEYSTPRPFTLGQIALAVGYGVAAGLLAYEILRRALHPFLAILIAGVAAGIAAWGNLVRYRIRVARKERRKEVERKAEDYSPK